MEFSREELVHIYQSLELKLAILRTTIDTHTSSVNQAQVVKKMNQVRNLISKIHAEMNVIRRSAQLFPEEES